MNEWKVMKTLGKGDYLISPEGLIYDNHDDVAYILDDKDSVIEELEAEVGRLEAEVRSWLDLADELDLSGPKIGPLHRPTRKNKKPGLRFYKN